MIKINIMEVRILFLDLSCASQVIQSYKDPMSHSRVSIEKIFNFQHLEPSSKHIDHAVGHNDYADDVYDSLLSAELMLPNESADGFIRGAVIKQAKNNIGQPIETSHVDDNLDTRRYIVLMGDGMENELQIT